MPNLNVQAPNFNISGPAAAFADYHDDEFENERQAIEERRLDLARELEEETRKRREAEEAVERLREEFLKKELEESRSRSELVARIEQLE